MFVELNAAGTSWENGFTNSKHLVALCSAVFLLLLPLLLLRIFETRRGDSIIWNLRVPHDVAAPQPSQYSNNTKSSHKIQLLGLFQFSVSPAIGFVTRSPSVPSALAVIGLTKQ